MVAKLRIVEEESDEAIYWMELLVESNVVPESALVLLLREANEILAMTVASIKTLQRRNNNVVKEPDAPSSGYDYRDERIEPRDDDMWSDAGEEPPAS
jgi:hypothetical protein